MTGFDYATTPTMPDLTTFEPRAVCPNCRRPQSVCYCEHLSRIETATRVILLQHPRERDVAIGTARMAHLCLANSELLVGFDWEHSRSLEQLLSDPSYQPALLYPGDDAQPLATLRTERPLALIVVDGTWANTKKMVRKNPVLAGLPRVAFTPERPSEYRIRREPKVECVSTIEALMLALGVIEGDPRRFECLLRPFRNMVDAQLRCKAERCSPRSRYHRPNRTHQSPVPPALGAASNRVVCVMGEANAWPCKDTLHRAKYPDELVQWAAVRLATGERFDSFASPCHPLSPNTPVHLAVDAASLLSGEPIERLLERWRDFVRDDDVICSWGCYATNLFIESGGYLPTTRFDLRLIAKRLMQRSIGTLDEYHALLGGSALAALASGRAGQRLGQLVHVAAHMRDLRREHDSTQGAVSGTPVDHDLTTQN
ncbi:MAG TPA: tRNA-uridine aminocarboxypropyltransferase [Polyangiaceae bacterium]